MYIITLGMGVLCYFVAGGDIVEQADKEKRGLRTANIVSVLIVIGVLLVMAVFTVIYAVNSYNSLSDNAQRIVLSSALGNSSTAEAYLESRFATLESTALRLLDAESMSKDEIEAILKETASATAFDGVCYARLDGMAFDSVGEGGNISHRVFFSEAINGERSLQTSKQLDFNDQIADIYAVPLKNRTGEIIGSVLGRTKPLYLSDMKLVGISGASDIFFIVNSDGMVMLTTNNSNLGLKPEDDVFGVIKDESTVKELEYIFNNYTAEKSMTITIDGCEYMAALSGFDGLKWTFVSMVPTRDVISSFSSIIFFTIVLIAVVSLLLVAATILLMKKMSEIRSMADSAVDKSMKSMYLDSVTGKETWGGFSAHFASSMKNTAANHALISIDIDKFKAVNDAFGYEGGNDILRQLSDIISRNIGDDGFYARYNGDQFYAMVEFSDSPELINIANRIISDTEYQITVVRLCLSIGIYIITERNIEVRAAVDRADLARKTLKDIKESSYAFFDARMIEQIRNEKSIEDIMDDALELGEFLVYLQPKFDLTTDEAIVGAEALVRWQHDGKIVPPGNFIPLFEKNGFIMKLDYYMFEQVCKLQKKWKNMGLEPKLISVNMSRLHLRNKNFVEDLVGICNKYDIDTKYFEIEITESAAYENIDILREVFTKIKGCGFHISIDDFGTGYSSLNMLKDLPVDVLKIDRSFLTESADEHESASHIIGCVVSLASALNIETICEGIETRQQADLLAKLGCDMAQGFFFARPMPVADFEKLAY